MFVLQTGASFKSRKNYYEEKPRDLGIAPQPKKADLSQTVKKGKEQIQASATITAVKTASVYLWNATDHYNTTIFNSKENDPTSLKIAKMGVYFSPEEGSIVASIGEMSSSAFFRITTKSGALTSLNPTDSTSNIVKLAEDEFTVLQKYLPQPAQSANAYLTIGLENNFAQNMVVDIAENAKRSGARILPASIQDAEGNWITIFDVKLNGVTSRTEGGKTTPIAKVEIIDRESGESRGAYEIEIGKFAQTEYKDLNGSPFCVYVRSATKDASGEEYGQASIGVYTNVSMMKQGAKFDVNVLDKEGKETGKKVSYTVNLGSESGYKSGGNFISFKPDSEAINLLPDEQMKLGAALAVLVHEGMKNRKLVEGTTSVETITIDYATEDMPYLKAGTKIIKGMVLDAGAEALFHPIFNNSSTTGGFRKVVFDPENKQIGYLQDNGLWIVKDLPGGLGMVSLGDMRVINGEVSGDGKVLTFDANNMRIGESSNARPGMNQTDFVYTYATFRRISSPMLDFQFDSQLLYRGYGETTFGQFGAPYTTQRGDEIKFIDVHQIGWSYSKDITKSTDQVTLNYKKAEKPEHKEPVGVEERQPIRMAPAQNLSFEMYQEVRIPYALSKNAKVSIYSVDGAKQNVHVNINEGEGFMLYPGALTPGNYGYGVQDGARSGNGMFNIR